MEDSKLIQVRVALRCRPLGRKEQEEGAVDILRFTPNHPQVTLQNKTFTYDHIFTPHSSQNEVYGTAVEGLIDNLFNGYNVTILAYGQTGSGKTYTMGTTGEEQSDTGIIPRVVEDIFSRIEAVEEAQFLVKVSFIEIHKEELYDLLVKTRESLNIREDAKSGIHIPGLTEHPVVSLEETMEQLELGTLSRSTAATNMNLHSSRSHAIFTLILERRSNSDPNDQVKAKLHLVDLAGSERAKKTGAQGERLKEGIQINRGLLALGNVISALCDESAHVPYRDSKLTRMLQDSLGGNSHTIMIACVSPADTNFEETLNTLRYADRARKIKNKPVVNRDPFMAELLGLREKVRELEGQLAGNKVLGGLENLTLDKPYTQLITENQNLKNENIKLTRRLISAISQTSRHCDKALAPKMDPDVLTKDLEELIDDTESTINDLNESVNMENNPELDKKVKDILHYQNRLKTLQAKKSHKEMEFTMFSPKPKKAVLKLLESDATSPAATTEEEDNYEKQAEILNQQLSELDQDLFQKENIMASLQENVSNFSVVEYQTTINKLETEISNLVKEKDELSEQLKAAKSSANASKVSEQRRKRLQELESQINTMKEELSKKNKMLKYKEDCDRKAKMYQQEIQSMKQARVKLMKRMKEESEKHRQWQNEKNREMNKLKQQEKKRQFQLVKLERDFTKERNVLQRKVEEANAACKRLQVVKKRQEENRRARGKQQIDEEKAKVMLSQELEMETSKLEAEFHLNNLINDRKLLSEKIAKYQSTLQANQKNGSCDPAEVERIKNLIGQYSQELALRTKKISSLKKDIDEINQENKASNKWEETIHSLPEAKIFMKAMFKELVNSKSEILTIKNHLQDSSSAIEELKKKHVEEMATLTQECEEKVSELARLEESLQTKMKECDELKEQVKNSSRLQRSIFPPTPIMAKQPTRDINVLDESFEPDLPKKTKQDINVLDETFELDLPQKTKPCPTKTTAKPSSWEEEEESQEFQSSDDDRDKDPDWRNTPLIKRAQNSKSLLIPSQVQSKEPKESIMPKKCKCKSSCSKKCGCYRANRPCQPSCRCNKENCQNNAQLVNRGLNQTETLERTDLFSSSLKTSSFEDESAS